MYLLNKVREFINNIPVLRDIFVKIISPFTAPILFLIDILSFKKFKRRKRYNEWKKNNPEEIYSLSNNLKIRITDNKLSASKSLIILNGNYEQNETFLLKQIVKEGWNILDIGANFGWYSLHFSKMVGNNGNVYAFEPIKQTYDELKSNLSLNNATNVKTLKFALGNKEHKTNFGVPFFDGGSAASSQHLGFSKKVKIPVFPLDKIFDQEDIKKVNLIKADIEGGELNLLLGAEKVLKKHKPNIFIEIVDMHCNRFGYKPKDIFNFLIKKNYEGFYIGNEHSDIKENFNKKDLIKPNVNNLPNGNYLFF